MKYYSLYLTSCILILLQGCALEDFEPTEWAVDPTLELSVSGVVFNAADNRDTIKVSTNYQSFCVSCDDSWCIIKPDLSDSTIAIYVEPNMKAEQRRTTIKVSVERGNKNLTKSLQVVQMGGYWDVLSQFSVYWSSDVTESQKETIAEMLSNMVYVKGSTFVMGRLGENYWYSGHSDADMRHNVTLTDFYINKTEVTQKQWNVIMGSNNSTFRGEKLPVENIEWEEALDFVSKLARLTNLNFVLPTEAQWEYAARGGIYSMGYTYPGSNDYDDVLIYKGDESKTSPSFSTYEVGTLWPNELGLYNLAGNVAEMCSDWYGNYDLSDQTDPMGPPTGKYHVLRGGDITELWSFCNVYNRSSFITKNGNYIGIRLCIRP